jgi:hypothetical protein
MHVAHLLVGTKCQQVTCSTAHESSRSKWTTDSRRAPLTTRAKVKPNTLINNPHWRIRNDTGDVRRQVTFRYLGKLRHLNVG